MEQPLEQNEKSNFKHLREDQLVKQLEPNLSFEERLQMLEDSCYKEEDVDAKVFYTTKQIQDFQAHVTENIIALRKLEEEKKAVIDEFKEKMRPLEQAIEYNAEQVEKGYHIENVHAYCFDEQELGLMAFYDENGKLIHSRPLYDNERQLAMKPIKNIKSSKKEE